MNISDTLRQEIGRAETLKEVSVEAGVPYACVYNFYHEGADIQLNNVQKLADYFGYRLTKSTATADQKAWLKSVKDEPLPRMAIFGP